jgi:diaminohydroxyphosphoribosylaminopyrimidine deaminase/5-amino-6-(5-phosphoribosylamino)uracil reductase
MATPADMGQMRRAISLAKLQLGKTGANPAVGCVIVNDGVVVGAAATADGGRPHAEEQALAQAGDRARGACAFVTLEPCAERTSGEPSCAVRLVEAGILRVVIACKDPSPLASGQGIERLGAAGIPVESGVLTEEAAPLYAEYFARLASRPASG